jgi:Pyruvate/2-oxoacid:ferredoxin oxidoreductase delta subunit
MQRKVVHIDEAKCDGCGLCVPSCAEGAIQIVDGKARLIADRYCDGLGACLGECPQDAITIVQREAEPFDEEAVRQQAARVQAASAPLASEAQQRPTACPGSMAQNLQLDVLAPQPAATTKSASGGIPAEAASSGLGNWPVQLHLVQPNAPFLQDADLLLVADCVPFALADFHNRFLRKRPVVIGCPKLDDPSAYVEKLSQIIAVANIRSITVIHMEVPCCTGLVWIAENALRTSGSNAPLEDVTVSIRGRVIEPGQRAEQR